MAQLGGMAEGLDPLQISEWPKSPQNWDLSQRTGVLLTPMHLLGRRNKATVLCSSLCFLMCFAVKHACLIRQMFPEVLEVKPGPLRVFHCILVFASIPERDL